jgi:hypothetical protein
MRLLALLLAGVFLAGVVRCGDLIPEVQAEPEPEICEDPTTPAPEPVPERNELEDSEDQTDGNIQIVTGDLVTFQTATTSAAPIGDQPEPEPERESTNATETTSQTTTEVPETTSSTTTSYTAPVVTERPPSDALRIFVIDAAEPDDVSGLLSGATVNVEEIGIKVTEEFGRVYWLFEEYDDLVGAQVTVSVDRDGYIPYGPQLRTIRENDDGQLEVKVYLVPAQEGYVATLQWKYGGVQDYDYHLICRDGPKGSLNFAHIFYGNREYVAGYEDTDLWVTLDRDARLPGSMETVMIRRFDAATDFCVIIASAFSSPAYYYSTGVTLRLYKGGRLIDEIVTEATPSNGENLSHKLAWYVMPDNVMRVNSDTVNYADFSPLFDNPWLAGGAEEEEETPYEDIDPFFQEYDLGREGELVDERDGDNENTEVAGGEVAENDEGESVEDLPEPEEVIADANAEAEADANAGDSL